MSIMKKREQTNNLEGAIEKVLAYMNTVTPDSKEYAAAARNLETLYSAKGKVKDRKISADTIAVIAGNLLGIGIIVGYERFGVIASKALGFVIKGRV